MEGRARDEGSGSCPDGRANHKHTHNKPTDIPRAGRIIVRKLLLRGFRVAVLVRSLSSETLNLLGSGVSYSYGDMTDYKSLLDAMGAPQ